MASSQPNISDLAASLITLYFTNSTTNLSRYAIDLINEKGDKTPHFDLNGIVWNKFRYEVKGELLRKVAIVG